MARLTEAKREDIKNALMLGDSQYKVSQEFEVSSATVNKIFKTIDEETLNKTKGLVKGEIAIKSIVSEQSERFSKSFDDKVKEEIRRKGLIFDGVEKAVKKMNDIMANGIVEDKINVGDGMQKFEERKLNTTDIKNALDGYDKASITLGVNQRHANQSINVNTQNNQITENNTQVLTEEEAKREAERLGVPLSVLI